MATRTKEGPKQPADETKQNVGKVVQVIGPVLDVEFEPEHLPEIYNAIVIDHRGNGEGGGGGPPRIRLTPEGMMHIDRTKVRPGGGIRTRVWLRWLGGAYTITLHVGP